MNTFSIIIIVITSLLMVYSIGAFVYGLIKKAIIKRKIKKDEKDEK